MKIAVRFASFAVAFLIASAAHAQTAEAPKPPLSDSLSGMAKADYVAARTLFNDGDAAGALVKFRSSYDASKDARLFWNIGACHKALRKYAEAIRDLERYEQDAAESITESDRKEADELIASLRPFVAALTVKSTPSDATVLVDGEPTGSTPLSKRLVDLGKHQVVARKDGFVDSTNTVDVTGNADVVMDLQLAGAPHEGRIVVNAGAGDSISIDGKAMAMGTWEGTVKTGEHAVRVTASKKQPYETHVNVADRETRTLQITLESTSTPAWIWISAGAAGAVAITVITLLVVGGGSEQASAPLAGTMQPGYITMPSLRMFSSFR